MHQRDPYDRVFYIVRASFSFEKDRGGYEKEWI
jgi:hypothetical protein